MLRKSYRVEAMGACRFFEKGEMRLMLSMPQAHLRCHPPSSGYLILVETEIRLSNKGSVDVQRARVI